MAHIREVSRDGNRKSFEVRWREHEQYLQKTFRVKREAERFAARIENQLQSGGKTQPFTKSTVTIRDAIQAVLIADEFRLRPRTFDSYKKIYAKRIMAEFASHRLVAIDRTDVQSWISKLTREGLSAGTVKHHYVALRKLFKWAVQEQVVAADPCEYVSLPRPEMAVEKPIISVTQLDSLAAMLESTPPYDLLVRFMAFTGLRLGEVAGLRVSDVELANRRVLVRQTAQRITDQGWVFGTPKSARSTREVPLLDSHLIMDLKTFLDSHPKSSSPHSLFWPGRAPGSREPDFERVLDGASFRRHHFKTALNAAALPEMRLHDLRHTAASLWLAAGFQPYEVSRWLGHANVSTTDEFYSHLYPTDFSDHLARFEAYQEGEMGRSPS